MSWLIQQGLLLPPSSHHLSTAVISRAAAHISTSRLFALYVALTQPLAVDEGGSPAVYDGSAPDSMGSLAACQSEAQDAALDGRLPCSLPALMAGGSRSFGRGTKAAGSSASGSNGSPDDDSEEDPWKPLWDARRPLHRSSRKVSRHPHILTRDAERANRAHCDVCGRAVTDGGVAAWWCRPCDFGEW